MNADGLEYIHDRSFEASVVRPSRVKTAAIIGDAALVPSAAVYSPLYDMPIAVSVVPEKNVAAAEIELSDDEFEKLSALGEQQNN